AAKTHWLDLLESRLKERALPSTRRGTPTDHGHAFLARHYAPDPQARPLRTSDVYAAYQAGGSVNGVQPVSPAAFGRQVRQIFGLAESRAHRFPDAVAKAWSGLRPCNRNP